MNRSRSRRWICVTIIKGRVRLSGFNVIFLSPCRISWTHVIIRERMLLWRSSRRKWRLFSMQAAIIRIDCLDLSLRGSPIPRRKFGSCFGPKWSIYSSKHSWWLWRIDWRYCDAYRMIIVYVVICQIKEWRGFISSIMHTLFYSQQEECVTYCCKR